MTAIPGLESLLRTVLLEGVYVVHRLKIDASATASIATIRPAFRHELLTVEADEPMPSVSPGNPDDN